MTTCCTNNFLGTRQEVLLELLRAHDLSCLDQLQSVCKDGDLVTVDSEVTAMEACRLE